MALSLKNKREIDRLRRDAGQVWNDQQEVLAKVLDLSGRATESIRNYADEEVVPAVRKTVDTNLKPAFERGVVSGRRALHAVEKNLQDSVLPAIAKTGGQVTGAVREFVDTNKTAQQLQARANTFAQEATKRVQEIQQQIQLEDKKAKKKNKKGPGVGGWFLIGAGVAALAAIGYALYQTFRADDDLWIADEELDAPVETVTRNS